MSATAFQRMRREAEAKAKASQKQVDEVESTESADQVNEEAQQEPIQLDKEVKQEQQQEAEQAADTIYLNDMGVEELTQYANEHGIEIGNATSQKGILKKIKESE